MINETIQGLLNSTFFQQLIEIILTVVSTIVSIILLPFSVLIELFLPDFSSAMGQVQALFNYMGQYMGWAINAAGIPVVVVAMITGYFTFAISLTIAAWLVKLFLKWKKALFA